MQKLQQSKYYPLLLYLFALTVVLIAVNYFYYLPILPSGEHFWRQTDSGSFVAYYYSHGMNFFDTGTYNLKPADGHTVSEFPILYYLTAALWHVFGRSEATLKIIDSIIVFSGFYCLFKVAFKQLGNIYIALLLTMVLLSSPMLLSYTNNFIPDPPALGFAFIGIYFFFRFSETKRYQSFIWCMFFIGLSSLIKISFGIVPISILGLLIADKLFKLNSTNTKLFEGNSIRYLIPLLLVFCSVIGWTLWSMHYNKINHSDIFLATITPYWTANRTLVHNAIVNEWLPYYYYFTALLVFMAFAIAGIILIKKWERLPLVFTSLLLAGGVSYVILFYGQFNPHDYYMILCILPVAFFQIFSLKAILLYTKRYATIVAPIMLVALLSLNVLSYVYSNEKIAIHKSQGKTFISLKDPELVFGKAEQYGIPQDATVYSFPDCSPNGSLYYLQRKGYTDWYNCDSTDVPNNLKQFIPKGAEYLVISNPDYYRYAIANWFESELVGQSGYVQMYKITSYDTTKWNR